MTVSLEIITVLRSRSRRLITIQIREFKNYDVPWVPENIFFLSILMVGGEVALTRKKITSGHRST